MTLDSLREDIADTLEAIAADRAKPWATGVGNPLCVGADALRWAESLENGDPPAAAASVADLEERIELMRELLSDVASAVENASNSKLRRNLQDLLDKNGALINE